MLKKSLLLFAAVTGLCAAEDFTVKTDRNIFAPGEDITFRFIRNAEGHLMHGAGIHVFAPYAPKGLEKAPQVYFRNAQRRDDVCYIFTRSGKSDGKWFPSRLFKQKEVTHTISTKNWPEGDYRLGVNLVTENPAKKQVIVKRDIFLKIRKKRPSAEELLAKVPWREGFKPLQKVQPTAQTRLKLTADADHVYALIEAHEPEIPKLKADAAPGSSRIWLDDDLEFALSPFGGKSIQYLWMVNSKGAVCELHQQDNNTGTGEMAAIPGWRSFAEISAKTEKDKFSVLYKIPFAALNIPEKPAWRFNAARSRYTVKPAEYSTFSSMSGSFNQVHRYTATDFPQYVPSKIVIENIRTLVKDGKAVATCDIINRNDSPRIVVVKPAIINRDKAVPLAEKTFCIPAGRFVRPLIALPEAGGGTLEILAAGLDGVPLRVAGKKISIDKRNVRIQVKSPGYRNSIFATMKDKRVILSVSLRSGKGDVTYEMTGPEGFREIRTAAPGKNVVFDLAGRADGDYPVTARCGGDSDTAIIRKLPPKKGEVRLDEDGVTLVDGRRCLPVGWFRASFPWKMKGLTAYQVYSRYGNPQELHRCIDDFSKQTGAMAVMFPYQEFSGKFEYRYFKDVQQMGKVTPEQKKVLDNVVEVTKNSPVLGWYLADEPEMFSKNPAWFEEIGRYLAQIDPYRPTLLLNCTIGGIRDYAQCADILFPDFYPDFFENGPRQRLSGMASFIREARKFRPAWGVIQAFAWVPEERGGGVPGRAPTFEELRSQFYQVFVADGKGVFLYDIYDKSQMFTSTRLGPDWLFDEADRLKNYLLDPNVKGLKVTVSPAKSPFDAALKRKDGRICIIAINYASEPVSMTFKAPIPDGRLHVASTGRSVDVGNGVFTDTLEPLAVNIYINSESLADGKESIGQLKARMAAFDRARRVPGNLLAWGEPRLLDYVNSRKGIPRPGYPQFAVSSRKYQYFSRKMGTELYMADGIRETAPRDSHMVWQPDDSDKTPTVSFTLPSPAKMNELRLYQATYLTFYNNRTVYRDLSVPGGVVEAQEKDGTWKRIARFAGSKDACIVIKLDGETRRSLRIVFDRPRFALSEVELF